VSPPGDVGPSAHRYPNDDEHVAVMTRGTAHTPRGCGDELGAVIGETRPAARIGAVITTPFGIAHEGLARRAANHDRCVRRSPANCPPLTRALITTGPTPWAIVRRRSALSRRAAGTAGEA